MSTHRTLILGMMVGLLLEGCSTARIPGMADLASTRASDQAAHPFAVDSPSRRDEASTEGALTLLEGIELYDNGAFERAIDKLRALRNQPTPLPIRLAALKYLAFSYCLIENYVLCRQTFDLALSVDPDFKLLGPELGHPMWGPVFEQAVSAHNREHLPVSVGLARGRWQNIDLWRAKGISP